MDDWPAYVLLVLVGVLLGSTAWQVGKAVVAAVRDNRARVRRMQADQALQEFADTYSPDVELNEHGQMVFTRDIAAGEIYQVPMHMLATHKRNSGP